MGLPDDLPHCQCDGHSVHVTLNLESFGLGREPSYAVWGVGDVTLHAGKTEGSFLTCRMRDSMFQKGDVLKLQILPVESPGGMVLPWTQIPLLREKFFEARMVGGLPVLAPIDQVETHSRLRRELR